MTDHLLSLTWPQTSIALLVRTQASEVQIIVNKLLCEYLRGNIIRYPERTHNVMQDLPCRGEGVDGLITM